MNPIEFFCHLQYVLSFKRFSIILIRKRIFFFNDIYIYCLKDLLLVTNVKLALHLIDIFWGKFFHLTKPLKLFTFRGNEFKTTNNAHTVSSFIEIGTFKFNFSKIQAKKEFTNFGSFYLVT